MRGALPWCENDMAYNFHGPPIPIAGGCWSLQVCRDRGSGAVALEFLCGRVSCGKVLLGNVATGFFGRCKHHWRAGAVARTLVCLLCSSQSRNHITTCHVLRAMKHSIVEWITRGFFCYLRIQFAAHYHVNLVYWLKWNLCLAIDVTYFLKKHESQNSTFWSFLFFKFS